MENYKDYGINFFVNANHEESISKSFDGKGVTYSYIFNPWLMKYIYFNDNVLRDHLREYTDLEYSGVNVATWEFGYRFRKNGLIYHEMSSELKSFMDKEGWTNFKNEVVAKMERFLVSSLERCDVLVFNAILGPSKTKMNRMIRYENFVNGFRNFKYLKVNPGTGILKQQYYVLNYKSRFSLEQLSGEFNQRLICESAGRNYKLYFVDKVSNTIFINDRFIYSPIYYGKLNGDLCTIYLCSKLHN